MSETGHGADDRSEDVELSAHLGPLVLPAPVLVASGCGGAGPELARYVDPARLGAFVTGSVSLRARTGRPRPRLVETVGGVLHATGLPNPGVEVFLARDLPRLTGPGARVIVSITGANSDEFAALARAVAGRPGVVGLEVNLTDPELEHRGRLMGADPLVASRVVAAVRRAADPGQAVLVKLGAEADLALVARACADAGADGVSLIGALPGIPPGTDATSTVRWGLSGPAIAPVALRCVAQVRRAVAHLPIVGGGGITTGRDALAFLRAGASAVSLGTAVLADPTAPARVRDELRAALLGLGVRRLQDAVGAARVPA